MYDSLCQQAKPIAILESAIREFENGSDGVALILYLDDLSISKPQQQQT